MRTAAGVLIFLAVSIRAIAWFSNSQYLIPVIGMLALFGGLLFSEPFLESRLDKWVKGRLRGFQDIYLLLQMALVVGLLLIKPLNDSIAMLFIPLSLQAVLFYQQRAGFLWIAFFTLATAAIFVRDSANDMQGVVMALLFGGCCFLAGSYANLIRKAEAARLQNRHTYEELQAAHQQLQGYAQQRQELAAEKERGRLARELHDSVTQTVFSMNLAAQSASLLWPQDPVRVNAQFDRFLELADSAMHEIKAMIAHLGPSAATGVDLVTAVKQLVAERDTLDSLQVDIEVCGEINLPETVSAGLYKVIQEALTNIAKHARTQQASIRLDFTANPIYVEIEDSGSGFDTARSRNLSGHIGLVEMAEQASEIGWELIIDSQPGRGTLVRVEEK